MNRREGLEQLYIELKWREYSQDPAKFFAECVQVPAGETLGGTLGRAPFELFDYQKDTLDVIRNNRYVIVLKARQLGLTTLAMAYAMWMLTFRPGSNIVLVSRSQTAADKALEIIDFMWSFLPPWVQFRGPSIENDAAKHHSYKFHDGMVSRITSYAATRTVAAGQTASLVLWDEAALAEYQDDALRTLLPTTDAGGSMLIFSTARGGYNAFSRLYRSAQRGENEFVPVFHPWHASRFMNPKAEQGEIDETYYLSKKRAMSSEPWRFYAEYPSDEDEAFRQSGRTRFVNLPQPEEFEDFPLRGKLVPSDFGRPSFVPDPDGNLWLRDDGLIPVPDGCRPVISLDPSSGTGGDYTAMVAGWVDKDGIPQRMAFWHANTVEPAKYAEEAYLLGQFFADSRGKEALMAVEKQGGFGDTAIHILRTLGYKALYVHRYTGHRRYRTEQTFGFPMSATRRPLVIDTLAEWLDFENGKVISGIDSMLRRELGAFVVLPNGRVSADVGMHDDMVMATAIWLYVALENGPRATNDLVGEPGDGIQVYSVNSIWEEAERFWAVQEKAQFREAKKFQRMIGWR
jgi:hypothetical protein